VLLIALRKPFMCFLTFFECSLSSSKALVDLVGFFDSWTFSFVALQTLSKKTKQNDCDIMMIISIPVFCLDKVFV